MRNEIENLELVQVVNFEIVNSLKNKGTKYLLFFDDSYSKICHSKNFSDFATAGRHRGFSTIYIKRQFFHQSKLGRDVELKNTHLVFFQSPRDMHQIDILNVQLGLGLTLVNWYRDATSVYLGHLLIDLSPRTDGRIRYWTNIGKTSSEF